MWGLDVVEKASDIIERGWDAGVLVISAGDHTIRLLPPLIMTRDQLARGALLIALGLAVAILAGTILARRMLVPITALRRGARRLGEGDFSHRIDVHTKDELEELADQFNSMAGQLHETYSGLESKVEERTRDLARSINELKVLEEVGRAGSSVRTTLSVQISLCEAPILKYGSEDQKRRYLPALATGDLRLQAFGVTEPDAGSDTTKISTQAVRRGDVYVVNGQKVFTSRVENSVT